MCTHVYPIFPVFAGCRCFVSTRVITFTTGKYLSATGKSLFGIARVAGCLAWELYLSGCDGNYGQLPSEKRLRLEADQGVSETPGVVLTPLTKRKPLMNRKQGCACAGTEYWHSTQHTVAHHVELPAKFTLMGILLDMFVSNMACCRATWDNPDIEPGQRGESNAVLNLSLG